MRTSILLCAFLVAQINATARAAEIPDLTAEPEHGATPVGVIYADKLLWHCDGLACVLHSGSADVATATCRQLAEQVGRVGYFGQRDRSRFLSQDELASCNEGIGDSTFAVIAPAAAQTSRGLVAVAAQPATAPDGVYDLRGIEWACIKGQCTASADEIDIAQCRELAQKIGSLNGIYLPGGKEALSPADLAACNGDSAGSGAGQTPPVTVPAIPNSSSTAKARIRPNVAEARRIHQQMKSYLLMLQLRGQRSTRPPNEIGGTNASMGRGGSDCNDSVQNIHPMAPEVCDGIDNDCDGSTDEGVMGTYFLDADGDLHGDARYTVQTCPQNTNLYATSNNDCDDTDPHLWIADPADPTRCEGVVALPFPDQATPLPEVPQ